MLILNKFTITITYLLVANNWIIFSVPAFFAGKELLIAPPPPSLLFKGVKYACPLPVFWNLTHLSNDYHQHVWYGFSRHPKWNVYSSKPPGTDTYFINSPPPPFRCDYFHFFTGIVTNLTQFTTLPELERDAKDLKCHIISLHHMPIGLPLVEKLFFSFPITTSLFI